MVINIRRREAERDRGIWEGGQADSNLRFSCKGEH